MLVTHPERRVGIWCDMQPIPLLTGEEYPPSARANTTHTARRIRDWLVGPLGAGTQGGWYQINYPGDRSAHPSRAVL